MSKQEDQEALREAVQAKAVPVYASGRADVVEAYRDQYGTSWKKHIVDDIMRANPGAKRASVRRQFEMDKRTGQERYKGSGRQSPATRARFTELGKQVAPVGKAAPSSGITVTVSGEQTAGKKGRTRDRSFTTTFTGAAADRYVNNPNFEEFWGSLHLAHVFGDEGSYDLDEQEVIVS